MGDRIARIREYVAQESEEGVVLTLERMRESLELPRESPDFDAVVAGINKAALVIVSSAAEVGI